MTKDTTIESPLAQMKRTGKIGGKPATKTEPVPPETQEREQGQPEPGAKKTHNGKREKLQVYISPDLLKWVKHQHVDQEREISEIVEEALRRYQASFQG